MHELLVNGSADSGFCVKTDLEICENAGVKIAKQKFCLFKK